MKINHSLLKCFVVMLAAVGGATSSAQSHQQPMSLQEAIDMPVIKDGKSRNAIANYQEKIATELYNKSKFLITMDRDNEVIRISIPADMLFGPNGTTLNHNASEVLRQYTAFVKAPDFYRMALAMYHDNTGSDNYCKEMTDKRIRSVSDWFYTNTSSNYIYYYSCGNNNPIRPNNSMENRRQNRRLDIYLIPGEAMIQQAKKGMIR